MLNSIRQKKWYRNLFPKTFYYKIKGTWKKSSEYKTGDKIEDVDGPWNSLYFCDCGNELSHSDSYIKEDTGTGVWEYKCTHCSKHQYANGTLGPFIIESDDKGAPIGI